MAATEPDLVRAIVLLRTGSEITDDPAVLHSARSLYNAVRRARTDRAAAEVLHKGTCTYAMQAESSDYWRGVRDTICGPQGAKHLEWILEQKPFIDCRNEDRP